MKQNYIYKKFIIKLFLCNEVAVIYTSILGILLHLRLEYPQRDHGVHHSYLLV